MLENLIYASLRRPFAVEYRVTYSPVLAESLAHAF